MKALSIKEPWVTLLHQGNKTIETRTWNTKYRGWLLLCASKKPVSDLSGNAFAIAELTDSRPMTEEDEHKACCKVYPKAHSWLLKNITPIEPYPVKGRLSLFNVSVTSPDVVRYFWNKGWKAGSICKLLELTDYRLMKILRDDLHIFDRELQDGKVIL